MDPDFVVQLKCNIFRLNGGLRVYLDMSAPDFPNITSLYFLHPSTFSPKHLIVEAFLV